MQDLNLEKYANNSKKLIGYLGLYTSASIFGPLIIFGGAGYLLDSYLGTKPWLIIVGVFVAFIFTNIFLYKKVIALTNYINLFKDKKLEESSSSKVSEDENKE